MLSTDEAIIRRIKEGQERAFEELVKKYYQSLYRFALLMTGDKDLAYDFSQEAFIRFHKNVSAFDAERPFLPYVFQIIRNLAKNYFSRYANRMVHDEVNLILRSDFSNPEQTFLQNERQQMVWEGIKKLSADERLIIILKDFDGNSYQDISEIMKIPLGTVMSRLHYARKKLGNILKGELNVDQL